MFSSKPDVVALLWKTQTTMAERRRSNLEVAVGDQLCQHEAGILYSPSSVLLEWKGRCFAGNCSQPVCLSSIKPWNSNCQSLPC